MAWRVLLYCFKVWVSALLIGTLFFVTLSYAFSRMPPDRAEFKFAGLFLAYGSGFSLPSLLLAWIGSFFILKASRIGWLKRLWIAILAAPLTLLPFIIFERGYLGSDWSSIFLIGGLYYLVAVAAIFLFRLPESKDSLSQHPLPDTPS
ncbi:MAG TPA: hypothetical protein VL978_11755 [Puia sp.]|nr:hypothetical protein [Puia sp.]